MLTGIISVLAYTIIYFCCPKQMVYDYFVLNVVFIIYRILVGVVLAYTYIIYQEKNCSAYWVTFWISCIKNVILIFSVCGVIFI